MRATPKTLALKISVIVFAVAVCIGTTAIQTWQQRAANIDQAVGGGGASFMPVTTPALW
jgi:hypothetical protein